FGGTFVDVDDGVALAPGDGHGGDLPFEAAVVGGGTGAAQRLERKGVLLFAGEGVFVGAVFGEHAHGGAALVGVFQAIECHVVIDGGMAVAIALAPAQQQVGGVAHAFLAAGHHDVGAAGQHDIVAEHGRLQARSADFVYGGAAN